MGPIETEFDSIKRAVCEALDEHVPQRPWLDTKQAAEFISCTPKTLKTWRSKGAGPRYHIINGKSVRYHIDDLNAFIRGEVL